MSQKLAITMSLLVVDSSSTLSKIRESFDIGDGVPNTKVTVTESMSLMFPQELRIIILLLLLDIADFTKIKSSVPHEQGIF